MVYSYCAYFLLLAFLFDWFIKRLVFKRFILRFALVLMLLFISYQFLLIYYLHSLFSTPSPLTFSLLLWYFCSQFNSKIIPIGLPLLIYYSIGSSLVIFSALAIINIDFYFLFFSDYDYLLYILFAVYLLLPCALNYGAIFVAWSCLIFYILNLSPSEHLLDAVSDVWLFLLAVVLLLFLFCSYCFKCCKAFLFKRFV